MQCSNTKLKQSGRSLDGSATTHSSQNSTSKLVSCLLVHSALFFMTAAPKVCQACQGPQIVGASPLDIHCSKESPLQPSLAPCSTMYCTCACFVRDSLKCIHVQQRCNLSVFSWEPLSSVTSPKASQAPYDDHSCCYFRALLPHQPAKFAAARNCIHNNHLFIKSLLDMYQDPQAVPEHLSAANSAAQEHARRHKQAHPGDMEKVRWVATHSRYAAKSSHTARACDCTPNATSPAQQHARWHKQPHLGEMEKVRRAATHSRYQSQ